MRAAIGKQIRCKKCQQVFRIVIIGHPTKTPSTTARPDTATASGNNTPETAEPAEQQKQDEVVASSEQPEFVNSDTKTDTTADDNTGTPDVRLKKRLNPQFFITIGLLIALTIAAIGLFIYLQFPQWLGLLQSADESTISTPRIKPVKLRAVGPPSAAELAAANKPVDANAGRNKSMLEGPDQPTQVCKDIAAEYWVRIHLMATARLETRTYQQLIKQGLNQPAEIRQYCRDRFLASRLTESAKLEKRPDWIATELELLTKN